MRGSAVGDLRRAHPSGGSVDPVPGLVAESAPQVRTQGVAVYVHQELHTQLRERGLATGDIRTIVLTHLHEDHIATGGSPAFGWLPGVMEPVLLLVWAVAGAWVPVLVVAEIRRARRARPRYERARWSTVFPLVMYSTACYVLAAVLTRDTGDGTAFTAALLATSHAMFWVAAAVWCATAAGLARRGWRAVQPDGGP